MADKKAIELIRLAMLKPDDFVVAPGPDHIDVSCEYGHLKFYDDGWIEDSDGEVGLVDANLILFPQTAQTTLDKRRQQISQYISNMKQE